MFCDSIKNNGVSAPRLPVWRCPASSSYPPPGCLASYLAHRPLCNAIVQRASAGYPAVTDLTGRSQIVRNVVVSWGSHLFIILAGFIVPRQINDNLGPEILGLWDLGWVTVRYLAITNLDTSSALNRYTALYRAQGDHRALSDAASTVSLLQLALALVVSLVSLLIAWLIVYWVEVPATTRAIDVQAMMLFLGLSLAVQMFAAPAGAIISGCHRWDLQHGINAAQDFLLAVAMVAVLWFGTDLVVLALLVLLAAVVTAAIRIYCARQLCPEINLRWRQWQWESAKTMLKFGAKSVIAGSPHLLIFQTVSFVLAGYAGPQTLAIVSRGAALIRICEQMIRKVATMFVPMTSGLIGLNREQEARELLLAASRYVLCAILPVALFLGCYGDMVLLIWMGEDYADRTMMMLLIAGSVLPIAQTGVMSVLQGFNLHGRIALINFALTLLCLLVLLPIATAWGGWSTVVAAGVISISWTLSGSLAMPFYLRRHFQIRIGTYLEHTLLGPLLANIPLLLLLYTGRQLADQQHYGLMLCCLAGRWCPDPGDILAMAVAAGDAPNDKR